MQGLARKGVDVVYIAGSNTVLAVGGQGVQGANIVLWDTNAHPRAPPVARMTHHSSLVTALQVGFGLGPASSAHPQETSARPCIARGTRDHSTSSESSPPCVGCPLDLQADSPSSM